MRDNPQLSIRSEFARTTVVEDSQRTNVLVTANYGVAEIELVGRDHRREQLLIAPRIVSWTVTKPNLGARIAVGLIAAALLIAALWWSKRRGQAQFEPSDPPQQRTAASV